MTAKEKGRYDKVGNWKVERTPRPKNEARLGKPEGIDEQQGQDEVPPIEMAPGEIINKMKNDRMADLKAKGMAPFLTLEEGENPFRIDAKKLPRICVNKYGREQVLLRVVNAKDGEEYDLPLSTNSPICRKLLEQMDRKNFGPFVVVRSGSGKDSRFSLKGY
jgi:hypothetical protein